MYLRASARVKVENQTRAEARGYNRIFLEKYHTYGSAKCRTCCMVSGYDLAELCLDDEAIMKTRINNWGWIIMVLVSALAVLIAVLSLLFIV